MICPRCGGNNGEGCDECDHGRIEITECPLELITPDVWEAIEYAELYEKGLPPVAGGVLNQAKIFIEACRQIWAEQAFWNKKLGILK